MNTTVSQLVAGQMPQYIRDENPHFVKFLEYYYKSQEKTGLSQDILSNLLDYANIDKYDINLIQGRTQLLNSISATDSTIIVESVENFLEENGSFLLEDEIVYYEKATSSPQVSLTPGISYAEFNNKLQILVNPYNSFDGITSTFSVTTESNLVVPPSANHLLVRVYGEYLVPGVDYVLNTSTITLTTPPRSPQLNDSSEQTSIVYLKGFFQDTIQVIDNLDSQFDGTKKTFNITVNDFSYSPILTEYTMVVLNNELLEPKVDYNINGDTIIFTNPPALGSKANVRSIEAPILSYGSGATGVAQISDTGEITGIKVSDGGSNYKLEYPPQVTIVSDNGSGAVASALVNGLKSISLLDGGKGFSNLNPPIVNIEPPTDAAGEAATARATVDEEGFVTGLELLNSGSRYTFTPRITFEVPGGGTLTQPNVDSNGGIIANTVNIDNPGKGYSVAPTIYVDEPTGANPITANITCTIDSQGRIDTVTVNNAGRGYSQTEPPRIRVVEHNQAQVLDVTVDGAGRVTDVEVLNGGIGFDDVPSIYIIDDRTDPVTGAPIGGTGAKATATIFNGSITDINITEFGTGYSIANPPKIIIQRPPSAKASAEVGFAAVTGFKVLESGQGYTQARFEGCVRGVSGLVEYDSTGNAIFENSTTAQAHTLTSTFSPRVSSLDGLFVQKMISKFAEQYLPNVPYFDYEKIDVINIIKNIRKFYASKGTQDSIAFLFKLIYGEDIEITYPKEQIVKPSAATWTIDTVLRCILISGDPRNITDGVLTQDADAVDTNVKEASALIENYLTIRTSDYEIYELILSEETIEGSFSIPYKTRLCEGISDREEIIIVDSTVGWPERNGVFVINGSEKVRYKEKSLNQFIECTRGIDGTTSRQWDAATEVQSDTYAYINKGTAQEVIVQIVGIVEAEQTVLTDDGSYYLSGDKLTVSKLGSTEDIPQLKSWIYNVKKLVQVDNITFGGVSDRIATVTCSNPHGLLVGDQVTVYGANPNLYNGTFLVQSREDAFIFKYELPQPASTTPQGNILISVDLNRGKSDTESIQKIIGNYTTNVQNTFFNTDYVYIAASGIPNYKVGPFNETALIPGNQRKLYRLPRTPETISTKDTITPGPLGTWANGVSIWSYKSELTKIYGSLTSVNITDAGEGYDASSPPVLSIDGGGGTGAEGYVIVNGSVTEIEVLNGGSGYTSSPLVSIVGGGGEGASATAIVTKGVVSRILLNSGGTGFTSRPDITIVGGGGSGATGRAQVRGPIKEIVVSDGGASYTSKPNITLSSGAGAAAQAIVNNGRIISIAIVAAGNGYTTPPEVAIYGDGFGAVARAVIDTDGENAGRVTGIEILNKGIGYESGTTIVTLTSVGSGAKFDSQVFEWTYNLQANSDFDEAYGAVFEGYNTQYGGEYAHIANPQRLRYVLGDNMILDSNGFIREQEVGLQHSPIIGWAFDGNPIYGPYAYDDPTDQSSAIRRMASSYALKTNLIYHPDTNPTPARVDGPSLTEYVQGSFVEDYQYNFGSGDLDQYNGRFAKTPDFPTGRYCYFVTIDASEAGNPVFPYVLGPSWNSVVDKWNLQQTAVQQNIPGGVVRFRDPYENVDIDVERTPNAETDTITFEDGDFIQLEPEDENRDSVIDATEQAAVNQLEEEDRLEVFDYFPTVKFDSRVDIEVETTTKFEDAKVDGFIIENPGQSYQVNDVLVFDDTDTDGYGISARVSEIKGKTIDSYTFEMINDVPYGVITCADPHDLKIADIINVAYTPIQANTNKEFKVSIVKGIEELNVTQVGTGYTSEVPITVEIDGVGKDAVIEPKLDTATGNVVGFNIINSGNGFTTDPRILVSHPQIFKKADYFLNTINGTGEETVIHNVTTTSNKDTYVVGKTQDAVGNFYGFVAKYNSTGIKVWEKSLRSNSPNVTGDSYCELTEIYVDEEDANTVIVAGHTKPSGINPAHNPDIIVAKYNQNNTGLLATLEWQREYAGISGISRGDYVTSLTKLTTDRYILGGYTDTNTSSAYDAFLIVLNELGNFVAKRKFTSLTRSEKLLDIVVHHETTGQDIDRIYYLMETAPNSTSNDKSLVVGKCQLTQFGLVSNTLQQVSNAGFAFDNAHMVIDEFNELWISAELVNKTNLERKNFWVGKYSLAVAPIWSYIYDCGNVDIDSIKMVSGNVDLFNHLNVGLEVVRASDKKVINHFLKISYNGSVQTNYKIDYERGTEGGSWYASHSDVSGDHVLVGQQKHNRTVALFDFELDGSTPGFGDTTEKTTNVTWTGDNAGSIGRGSNTALDVQGYDINAAAYSAAYLNVQSADTATLYGLGDMTSKDFTVSGFFNASAQYVTAGYTGANPALFTFGDWTGPGISVVWDRTGSSGNSNAILLYANATALYGSSPIVSPAGVISTDTWHFVSLTKSGNTYTLSVDGTVACQATAPSINLNNNFFVANAPGFTNTAGVYDASTQFSGYIDGIKISDRVLSQTAPSTTEEYTAYYGRTDYIHTEALLHKLDKVTGTERTGRFTTTNNGIVFNKTDDTTIIRGAAVTNNVVGYDLATEGYQVLDYNDVASTLTQDIMTVSQVTDVWATRTATIPAPGSKKVRVTPKAYGKFFIAQSTTTKVNNVQRLTTNAFPVNFTKGSTLQVWNAGTIAAQAKIIAVNTTAHPNTVDIADIVGEWDTYLDSGELRTNVNDVNEIKGYTFPEVVNTTPGVFDFNLAQEDFTLIDPAATNNLHLFARFKPHSDPDYSVRIDDISGSSEFVVGSVVSLTSDQLSFNSDYNTLTISGLTGVTKITLVTNLTKIVKYSAINNTDVAYVTTATAHYLQPNEIIHITGNSGDGTANDYDGSFYVKEVFTSREFTYTLRGVPTDDPADGTGGANSVIIYAKTPVLPMFYGHQYVFDVSDPSMQGYYLTFSKDNLYKLEYSFNAIERSGTPGVVTGGVKPYVSLAVNEEVTNISYYFDPSRTTSEPPMSNTAYLDVQTSPYVGRFRIEALAGATITSGATIMKFPLTIEPEGAADRETTSYSTEAESAVGPIANIRIVNGGGFYKKLPVVDNIVSSRKIERVQITDPGTEYAVGVYYNVPIQGDGEGGFVQITVEDGLDDEGVLIPGQISQVVVTSPGKNYTTAFIDVEAITGILGASLAGSGAELTVVIPPAGSGASVFVKGTKVGKIKKLKNNNFGFDYPQDYTLRPEISFPVNLQLINTSVLSSIKVTDPGSGYSQAPTVIIEGGGGEGATAVANIKNGRIESIEVKDPGAGYSSEPSISLNSAFSYVINLDLNLFQFSFPHGIPNGAEVKLTIEDNGDGDPAYGITAFGPLVAGQTYYAITGIANGLEGDQMRLALTPENAAIGDFLSFVNAGTGRQIVLTESFGGAAEAIVATGQFLSGERIYQGESLDQATAFGYISENEGWQSGPKILKVTGYTGTFEKGEKITGTISKSSGTIDNLNMARGVLNISSITKTPGKFTDDIGKPSEIIQKIQDSYYYQDFSYSVKSSVSVDKWRDIVTKNAHPGGFKIFGELGLAETAAIENKEIDFELVKSVNLADSAVVPNIQNFTLVEPIYTDFNNTEVLFRQKRLTSSEQILTSVVQRLDDISSLFDGVRFSFPLTVEQNQVVSTTNQLMVVMNGVIQTPGTAYEVQGDQIVFAEPPQPPASVKYVDLGLSFKETYRLGLSTVLGTYPPVGYQVRGVITNNTALVVRSGTNELDIIYPDQQEGTPINPDIMFRVGVVNTLGPPITQGNGYTDSFDIATTGGSGTGLTVDTNTDASGHVTSIVLNQGGRDYQVGDIITVAAGDQTCTFEILVIQGEEIRSSSVGFSAFVDTQTLQANNNLFEYQENITDFQGDIASVEAINLDDSTSSPIGTLNLSISASATFMYVETEDSEGNALWEVNKEYQVDAEIFTVQAIDTTNDRLTILRGQLGTAPVSHQNGSNIYSTDIIKTNNILVSKTTGTYQSTPGLFDINTDEYIISARSGIVAQVVSSAPYRDPVTQTVVPQVNISDGSSFFGLLFNRLVSAENPNTILDDISQSQIQVVDVADNETAINDKFPGNEVVRNTYLTYNPSNVVGTGFTIGETLRNYKILFGGQSSDFITDEEVRVNKLSFFDSEGDLVTAGQTIYAENATAEVIGTNYGRKWFYLGKQARGADFLHSFTFTGDAKISNVQSKFGGTSLYLDGTGDYVDVATHTEFGFGTGDWTIEGWIRPGSVAAGSKLIFDMRSASSDRAATLTLNGDILTYIAGNSGITITGTTNIGTNTWYHVAVCRSNNSVRMFLNGVQEGPTQSDPSDYGSTRPIRIGADYTNANLFVGYIDEVRVSTNARYAADFTPRAGIFQGDVNTVLLTHFDGENNDTDTSDWSGVPTYAYGNEYVNTTIPFRYYDACDQIDANASIIADEAVEFFKNTGAGHPDNFTFPNDDGGTRCKQDIVLALDALTNSIRSGGNSYVWDAAAYYRVEDENNPALATLSHVDGEVPETIYVMRIAEDIAIATMRNQFGIDNIENNTGSQTYNAWNAVDDIYIDAANEIEANINYIAAEALDRGIAQFPSSTATLTTECSDDIKDVLRSVVTNLKHGGNNHVWDSAWWFLNGGSFNHITTNLTETVWIINSARDLATEIMQGQPSTTVGSHGLTPTIDSTITVDPANPRCAAVESSIDTLMQIITDTLQDPSGGDSLTYPLSITTTGEINGRVRPSKWPVVYSTLYTNAHVSRDTTITIDPLAAQNNQLFCANVETAIEDHFNIITQTIEQANAGNNYLNGITRVVPDYIYSGGSFSGYLSVPFTAGTVDNVNDYIVTYQIDSDDRHRFKDSANLIRDNINVIVDEAIGRMLAEYPSLTQLMPRNNGGLSDAGTTRCRTDLVQIANAVADDLEVGGNEKTIQAVKFYIDSNGGILHVRLQLLQSLFAHEQIKELCKDAIDGTLQASYSNSIVVPPIGITTDTAAGGQASYTPTTATYDAATGDSVITIGTHSLPVGSSIYLVPNSMTFTCAMDGGNALHTYPRTTDPNYQKYFTITGTTATTITVNAGASPIVSYNVSNAYYNAATGNLQLTIGTHSLPVGTSIKLAANSLTFTCSSDNHASTHTYPRASDPAYDTALKIHSVGPTTISINVGVAAASAQYEHRFVSATAGAVVSGGNYAHTFSSALPNSVVAVGKCADVKAAIDTMLDQMNAILAPTGDRFVDAGNALWKNQDYIAEEAAGALDAYFTYEINNVSYKTFEYPGGSIDGRNKCIRDVKELIKALITDLLTGGNSNTVIALETYIDANKQVLHVEDQLPATLYALNYAKMLAQKAINQLLQTQGSVQTSPDHYVALYTTQDAYIDTTVTHDVSSGTYIDSDCVDVKTAIETLWTLPVEQLAPGGLQSVNAMNAILFNENYYKEEIAETVKQEWGINEWDATEYEGLIDTITDDIVYDVITTPLTSRPGDKFQDAGNLIGINRDFIAEEVVARLVVEYPALQIPGGNSNCVDDIKDILDAVAYNLRNGGNHEVWDAAALYVDRTQTPIALSHVETEVTETLWAINAARDMAIEVMRNNFVIKTGSHNEIQVRNHDITLDDELPLCAEVAQSITTMMDIIYQTIYQADNSQTDFLNTVTRTTPGRSTTYNNTETLATLRTLPNLLNNEGSVENILSNTIHGDISENMMLPSYQTPGGWYRFGGTIDGTQYAAPNGSMTADKWIPGNNTTQKVIYFNYPLSTYSTYDGSGITYDNTSTTFDTGAEGSSQKFTYSCFYKEAGYGQLRFHVSWGMSGLAGYLSNYSYAFFNFNLISGEKSSNFVGGGMTVDDMNVIPYGDGWYRCYITFNIPFGIAEFRVSNYMAEVLVNGAGNGTDGILIWGAKLNTGVLDAYEANSDNKRFYTNKEYNIKSFILDELYRYYQQSMDETLVTPSTRASFPAFYKSDLEGYSSADYMPQIQDIMGKYKNQWLDSNYYETVASNTGITYLTKTYVKPNSRTVPTPLGGGLISNEYIYGTVSGASAESGTIFSNAADVQKMLIRLRYTITETDPNLIDAYTIGMTVTDVNEVNTTGTIYALYEDSNYKYMDIIDNGTVAWTTGRTFIDMTNSEESTVDSVEYRMVVVRPIGAFGASEAFKGYDSGTTGIITQYFDNNAAVLDNTGGKLTIDTDSLNGSFEETAVIYADKSSFYIDAYKHVGSGEISLSDKILSQGYVTLTVTPYVDTFNNITRDNFVLGGTLYKIIDNIPQAGVEGVISGWDSDTNTLYVSMVEGAFQASDIVATYVGGGNPVGQGAVSAVTNVASQFAATVVSKRDFIQYERLYITDIKGTATKYDTIVGPNSYKAAVTDVVSVEGRVKRFFVGFDGTQTNFKITSNNGDPYFPDPAGHLMTFVNGVLQPPGASNAYTAFSDEIQFTEAPESGSSFTGYYVGKLRFLNDISFEFDSLRSSFNLLFEDSFYSLTLTEGVQSTVIRPENNIVVSLNGVLQEPGIGFELVGSRIIFSEIPRFGSTFVGFSYIGSDADVVAATVVPPLESGDLLDIEGETEDREIAIIESSNSLITFDYLGSIFGKDAAASAQILRGRITDAQITSPGDGYTTRPVVRVDSTSGFDGQLKALVGVQRIDVKEGGANYGYATVTPDTEVPEGHVYPDINAYPAEGTAQVLEEDIIAPAVPANNPPQSGDVTAAADGIQTLDSEGGVLAGALTPTVISGFNPEATFVNVGNSPTVPDLNANQSLLEVDTAGTPLPALHGIPLGSSQFPDLGLGIVPQNEQYSFTYRAGTNTANPMHTGIGPVGIAINGVVLSTAFDDSATLPTTTLELPTGFYWNRVFHEDKYGVDACSGVPDQQSGEYSYRSGSFLMNCWTRNFYRSTPYLSDTNFKSNFYRHPDGHSKIIGWASDGYPIYGPFGYRVSAENDSGVKRMTSSYRLLTTEAYGRTHSFVTLPPGSFINDYEYVYGLGDLDIHNGRFCVTPEFPNGTYAYFMTINADGNPIFPYIIGNATRQQRAAGFADSQLEVIPLTAQIIDDLENPDPPPTPEVTAYIIPNFDATTIWSSSFT